MPHPVLVQRLEGIREALMSEFKASASTSSASRGLAREVFVRRFLKEVMPPMYRFGTGDIIGALERKAILAKFGHSGQLDIVIEKPYMPSLPTPGNSEVRVYLSEGVAAVVEVKSDLRKQWHEAVRSAERVKCIRRQEPFFDAIIQGESESPIPYYVVGYRGWKKSQTLSQKVSSSPIDGALIINEGIFCGEIDRKKGCQAGGAASLWALIACLTEAVLRSSPPRGSLMAWAMDMDAADQVSMLISSTQGIDVDPARLRDQFPEEMDGYFQNSMWAWELPSPSGGDNKP